MKKVVTICFVVMLTITSIASADTASAIQNGADRLSDTQYNGKWGWPVATSPTDTTYDNITGPIGMGMINAYSQTGDVDHINSAKAAGNSLVGLTSDWIGTYNPLFLVELTNATGDNSYLTQAQTGFSELNVGTYTRKGTDYTTASYIQLIEDNRYNLTPWEFAPMALAAQTAGSAAQVTAFTDGIKDGINMLDPSATYSDMLGLAGGVMGLSTLGEDFDPTSGAFAAASSTADLADMLAGYQNADGSWYDTTVDGVDEDLQVTAYALLALDAANSSGQYNTEIGKGVNYLVGMQNVDGSWPAVAGGDEYSEINGEVVWALSTVPEPATMAILGFGALFLRKRKA